MNPVEAAFVWLGDPANWSGPNGIANRLIEHVEYSTAAMLVALAIALPVGLYIGHSRRWVGLAVNLANIGRAIPSLALIGLIVPFTQPIDPNLGFFFYPTLIAMAVLAIPPILVNADAGISEVERDLVEAARGMGFREPQILTRVEIPLALPVIIGGIRSASVQVIATTTLGAIFGLGGLGRFIIDGIAQNDDGQLWSGVLLVAALAILSEAALSAAQRLLAPERRSSFGLVPQTTGLTVEAGQPRP